MMKLNLPEYPFKLKKENDKILILDEIRKMYVVCTPEEWVRQHFVKYLIHEKKYPAGLLAVEKSFTFNRLSYRADIVAHDKTGAPRMIVECKAPGINITQQAFDQAARYNFHFRVKYLILTNGMKHYCCKIDLEKNSLEMVREVPGFGLMKY